MSYPIIFIHFYKDYAVLHILEQLLQMIKILLRNLELI